MTETSTSIAGAKVLRGLAGLRGTRVGSTCAIVGTGPSMEGLDLTAIDACDFSIGMNEAPKLYLTDYLCIVDERAVAKVMRHVGPLASAKGSVGCFSSRVVETLVHRPPLTRDGICADEEFARLAAIHEFRTSTQITDDHLCCVGGCLSAALSLAKLLGAAEVRLFGCDFYRYFDQKYAFTDGDSPAEMLIPVTRDESRFTTPAMQQMVNAIEIHRHVWSGMRIVNMNPLSELRCFEGGRREEW